VTSHITHDTVLLAANRQTSEQILY